MQKFLIAYCLFCCTLNAHAKREQALFAGGCFWCVEAVFDKVPGVMSTTSGFTGGREQNPTYKQVSRGRTGHTEAVLITYDNTRVSYQQLLTVFWKNIDPFDTNGQFVDRGQQYRAEIFYFNAKQKKLATASKHALEQAYRKRIVTRITPATHFYPAENYHQNFARKNPWRYKLYTNGNGRERRLNQLKKQLR